MTKLVFIFFTMELLSICRQRQLNRTGAIVYLGWSGVADRRGGRESWLVPRRIVRHSLFCTLQYKYSDNLIICYCYYVMSRVKYHCQTYIQPALLPTPARTTRKQAILRNNRFTILICTATCEVTETTETFTTIWAGWGELIWPHHYNHPTYQPRSKGR